MKNPMRIAVIGAGVIGLTHIRIIGQSPLCEVAAIADPTPAAAAFAAEQGLPYFADYVELLDAVRPDGAIIATPNALHVPVGLACVERGVPMLVEKPIADSVEASQSLILAAERAGVPLLVGHYRRHNPITQQAREIVRGGRIGQLTAATGLYLIQKPDSYFDVAWRRAAGGGPVLINLIHAIDDLRFICGEIAAVQAVSSNAVRGFEVEDTAAVIVSFQDGALATLTVSDAVATPWSWEITAAENPFFPKQDENSYYFAGTEGSLALPKLELWSYKGEKGWGAPLSRDQVEVQPADPFVRQLQHFCQVILGEQVPLISGADATRTLAATLAVKQAAENGCAVKLV
ncbi:MAG TPA: Gfo/Idh/MocA family oxidoreductase [Geobacteraceae bacterium]